MIRRPLAAGLLLALAAAGFVGFGLAQDGEVRLLDRRYNIEFNPISYPQKTPQEALAAIVKTLDSNSYEYMMAHLIDPSFVEKRVAEYYSMMFPKDLHRKEVEAIAREEDLKIRKKLEIEMEHRLVERQVLAFGRLVAETRKHFAEDPVLRRELRLLAKNGDWEVDDSKASVSLKMGTLRKAFFKIREGRWFMEERQQ
jgi:hypothetical protein